MNIKGIIIMILELMGNVYKNEYKKEFEKMSETEQKWILNQN